MFDGTTYIRSLDKDRLSTALQRVFYVGVDCSAIPDKWYTLHDFQWTIKCIFGEHYSEAGISARLRDVRKPKFGSHAMESRRRDGGLWEYRIIPNTDALAIMKIVDPYAAERLEPEPAQKELF
jgi:hypothetical protein